MLKKLIKISNDLDQKGHRDKADVLDAIMTQHKEAFEKLAGRDVGLEHEEHAKSLEDPDAQGYLSMADFSQQLEKVFEVADLIVGGSPITGEDAEVVANELADILTGDEHANTINAIHEFFEKMSIPQ
jgi:hypothetical protein